MSNQYDIADKLIIENAGKLTFGQIIQKLIDEYGFTKIEAEKACKSFMKNHPQKFDVHPII